MTNKSNLSAIIKKNTADAKRDERRQDEAALNGVKLGDGEVLVRLRRPAFLADGRFLTEGNHVMLITDVPPNATILAGGRGMDEDDDPDEDKVD